MTNIRYGIHWLSFVVFAPKEDAFKLYNSLFRNLFGDLESLGSGGRGFKEIWHSLLEFKVYVDPSRGQQDYFHFEIPGRACELIPWEKFLQLEGVLNFIYPEHYRYKRLDFAFDNVPFIPQDMETAIKNNDVRSLAKRKSLKKLEEPFEKKDNGEIGTYTVYFGSRQSERMIRVYNKRGFTRLELELKDRRANLVAVQLFSVSDISEWHPIALSHLQDFIEVDTDWWREFVSGTGRAWATVSTPREVSQEKTTDWLEHQVSAALSVIHDIRDDDFLKDLIRKGRVKRKRNSRYNLLLNNNKRTNE